MKLFAPENFLILVVDDTDGNVELLMKILAHAGYNTTLAKSGKQALQVVKKPLPDLILLDLMMPEINGLQVCQYLKADPKTCEIPIIFLTASNAQEHILQAFELGAVDYVTKPFQMAELLARVRTHLELKQSKEELKKAMIELELLATTDPLTEISNRRHILACAEREFNRASRFGNKFSILIIDIDHFKKINDTYGHAVGDEALKLMTKATIKYLRRVDYFGRLGGEEFVVILPETTSKEAVSVAERILNIIASLSMPVEEKIVTMTASIGISCYSRGDKNIEEVFKRADKALYQAKNQGRNQVVVYKNS